MSFEAISVIVCSDSCAVGLLSLGCHLYDGLAFLFAAAAKRNGRTFVLLVAMST